MTRTQQHLAFATIATAPEAHRHHNPLHVHYIDNIDIVATHLFQVQILPNWHTHGISNCTTMIDLIRCTKVC